MQVSTCYWNLSNPLVGWTLLEKYFMKPAPLGDQGHDSEQTGRNTKNTEL
jgi:hypothetical protein